MILCCNYTVLDEKDGLVQTVRQGELLIQEKQTTENQLLGQVAALKLEISTLLQTKEDVCCASFVLLPFKT